MRIATKSSVRDVFFMDLCTMSYPRGAGGEAVKGSIDTLKDAKPTRAKWQVSDSHLSAEGKFPVSSRSVDSGCPSRFLDLPSSKKR